MFTPPTRSKEPSDYLTVPLRIALGLSFLFPVADRLGILGVIGQKRIDQNLGLARLDAKCGMAVPCLFQ
jgi:hypothetical protein